MKGQAPLDALPDQSPTLTYQNATVRLYIQQKEYYAIYLGANDEINGTGQGVITYNMTLPRGSNTITILEGNTTLKFRLTTISESIQDHYSRPPPSLISSLTGLILTLLKGIGATLITLIIMSLAVIPPIIRKKEREPQVW